MSDYRPPFTLTEVASALAADICEQVGRITVLQKERPSVHLRRENRIRTIHSSLAIENNTLSLEQVTAVIDGRRVLGNPNEIREVQNAYQAYEMMLTLDPTVLSDLLTAHRIMMSGLIGENGRFRTGGVGIFDGDRLVHMAPPAQLVPQHMANLFEWYKSSPLHPLLKSAVFHYEFEFIHPFADGNGRMGRMWHTMLLGRWRELFYWLPMEELIKERQREYYDALGQSDRTGECSRFVELILEIIRDTLVQMEVIP